MNDIYLNTLVKGAAVHQARGMLSMVEDVDLLNFDCISNNGRSSITGEEDSNESEAAIDDKERWDLILYPNPASSLITLESNLVLEKNTAIEIYNALGQSVKTITVNEAIQSIDIDVSLFLDGIYTLRLKNKENIITKSFVVVK
jgi:hypothetical protein